VKTSGGKSNAILAAGLRASRRIFAATAAAAALCAASPCAYASSLFLVRGAGWGHGVGMSQWGAEGYALHGWDFRRILAHYYPHTQLTRVADQPIRILLAEGKPKITLGSAAPFVLVDALERRVHVPAGSLVLTPRLRLGRTALVPPVSVLPGAQPLSLGGVGYRGSLTVERTAGALVVVNTLQLERYLRGVVPSEMPGNWQSAAYLAQAVAARSYVLASMKPAAPFDVYADNRDQMYGGIPAESAPTNVAVGATAGEVLTYDGHVITAYYDSNSGGRTAAVQDVFAGYKPEPYLVSVRDPYDSLSPNHRWRVAVLGSDLADRFRLPVADVRVVHNGSGVVSGVQLIGASGSKMLTGADFAQALALRSFRFSVSVVSLDESLRRVRAGATLQLHGFLRQIGGVVLQQRLSDGAWRQVLHVRARPDGRFVALVRPQASTTYRLAVGGVPGPSVNVQTVARAAGTSAPHAGSRARGTQASTRP
jgi:stage II sporulation protein D